MTPPPSDLRARLLAARDRAAAELLAARCHAGHWLGELSSSALSTATAVCALALADAHQHQSLIHRGLQWLANHINSDGGWGDTDRSISNISTTTLAWAAFGAVHGATKQYSQVIAHAERWLIGRAGSLDPKPLADAIARRYGTDRTFSVPILTMAALAGRLGPPDQAWRFVPQLPFELAALPHQCYSAVRLPVVSYALPALIAIGQVRHHFNPSRNLVARHVRNATRDRTLRTLASIQPVNGGFLEAIPLTSFVTMSLAAMHMVDHPVARQGVEFLKNSARSDGSWPIDSNLATWVTTLSVNALGSQAASLHSGASIARWLLHQQYRLEHPYTHAAPGGWAWTDLPGGVPDADDTAGALLALRALATELDQQTIHAACGGVRWLLDLQNRDGGIPTFCRGWGTLAFDRSAPDITAHALRAWLAWRGFLTADVASRIDVAVRRALKFLASSGRSDGSWLPLWFGHQQSPDDDNPLYGTAAVISALASMRNAHAGAVDPLIQRGLNWLIGWQQPDGGWSGARGARPSVEETGLAAAALAEVYASSSSPSGVQSPLQRGLLWLIERVENEQWTEPSPIGFYFARLWYYEKLYPLIFTTAALTRAASLGRLFPPEYG